MDVLMRAGTTAKRAITLRGNAETRDTPQKLSEPTPTKPTTEATTPSIDLDTPEQAREHKNLPELGTEPRGTPEPSTMMLYSE